MRALLTCILCLLAFRALAERRVANIEVKNIRGLYSPSPQETRDLFDAARIYIKAQTGVTIRVTSWRNFRAGNTSFDKIGTLQMWSKFNHIVKQQKDKHSIAFNLYPPFIEKGTNDIAIYGESFPCALASKDPRAEAGWGDLAIARTTPDGFDMMPYSFVSIVHELGHTLGAFDDISANPVTIMNTDILHYLPLPYPLNFSEQSKREIRRCFFTTR